MRSAPPQHQHEPEDFILPRLFDSLGLTSNAKLFGEAQAGGKMRQTTTLTRIIPAERRRRTRARLRSAGRGTTTSRSSPGTAKSSPGGSTAFPRVLGPACTARWPRSGPSSAATIKRVGRAAAGGGGEAPTARRASTS
ncbi:unnamed protein product [Ectocarpus fasciculatus]